MKSTNKHLSSAHITEMSHGRYIRVYAIYLFPFKCHMHNILY